MSAIQSSEPIVFNGIDITGTINFASIYVSNLPDDIMFNGYSLSNENGLKYFFEIDYPLGKVKRVDIATRPNHGGGHVKCAFIHFEQWYQHTLRFRMSLAAGNEHKLYGPSHNASFYSSLNYSYTRFLVIKMNKTPIEEVPALEAEKMNIHQLVDNYKRLETTVAEKDAKIDQLEKLVKHLQTVCENRLETIHDLEFELLASRCNIEDPYVSVHDVVPNVIPNDEINIIPQEEDNNHA